MFPQSANILKNTGQAAKKKREQNANNNGIYVNALNVNAKENSLNNLETTNVNSPLRKLPRKNVVKMPVEITPFGVHDPNNLDKNIKETKRESGFVYVPNDKGRVKFGVDAPILRILRKLSAQ